MFIIVLSLCGAKVCFDRTTVQYSIFSLPSLSTIPAPVVPRLRHLESAHNLPLLIKKKKDVCAKLRLSWQNVFHISIFYSCLNFFCYSLSSICGLFASLRARIKVPFLRSLEQGPQCWRYRMSKLACFQILSHHFVANTKLSKI